MKRRGMVRAGKASKGGRLSALALLGTAFGLGAVLGCCLAGHLSDTENSALLSYMEGYLSALRNGGAAMPGPGEVLWETFRWHGLVFLLSFTAVGLVGIPVVFGIRGFLLSFAVASLIRVLGGRGVILAALVFGMTGLLSFPAFFVLGTQGAAACRALARRSAGGGKTPVYDKPYFIRCGLCAGALAVCACLERRVLPSILMILAGTF